MKTVKLISKVCIFVVIALYGGNVVGADYPATRNNPLTVDLDMNSKSLLNVATIYSADIITKGPWVDARTFVTGGDGSAGNPWTSSSGTGGIQEAIDYLPSTGGVVFAPKGVYLISTPIMIKSRIVLMGAGQDITTLKMANSMANDKAVIRNFTPGGAEAWSDSIVIRDLTIDGNKANQTATGLRLVWLRMLMYSSITNVKFINGKGVALDGINNFNMNEISFNNFINNGDTAIRIGFVSNRNRVTDNYVAVVTANENPEGIPDPTAPGNGIEITDMENLSPQRNFNSAENIIKGNVVKGYTKGIVVRGSFANIITGNVLGDQGAVGIAAERGTTYICDELTIDGNQITGPSSQSSTDAAIKITGRRIAVRGNIISGTSAYPAGIIISDDDSNVSHIRVTGNEVFGVQGVGILVSTGRNIIISDNIIHDGPSGMGIRLYGGIYYVSIVNNQVEDCGYAGIRLDSGPSKPIHDILIHGNIVKNCSKSIANQPGIHISQWSAALERVSIRDNLIIDDQATPTTGHGIVLDGSPTKIEVVDNRCYGITGNPTGGTPPEGTVTFIGISGTNTGSKNLRGSVTLASSSSAAVSFSANEPDTNYYISFSGSANETFWVTGKAVGGFTINSSNATSTATVDWHLIR